MSDFERGVIFGLIVGFAIGFLVSSRYRMFVGG